MEKKDIFDKIMDLPILNIFTPFYQKYKEILLYLFFGGLTFFLNIFIYYSLNRIFFIDILIANALSWIVCVLFQFFTNKIWVFKSFTKDFKDFFKQMFSFTFGRLFTLVVEEIILFIFIDLFHINDLIVKLFAQIIVILLNYIISKLFVFKDNGN